MKVWELIAELVKAPAGADVTVQRGSDNFSVYLERVESDCLPELVSLVGDGTDPSKGDAKP